MKKLWNICVFLKIGIEDTFSTRVHWADHSRDACVFKNKVKIEFRDFELTSRHMEV